MAVSKISFMRSSSGVYSYSPSNWAEGIYYDGTFYRENAGAVEAAYLILYDSHKKELSRYPMDNGEEVELYIAFPDYPLIGCYISGAGQSTGYTPFGYILVRDYLSACDAPTTVEIEATDVAPGLRVTLSWSDAKAGGDNPITAYQIHRATSPDGPYSLLNTVSSTATSGSYTVTAPTEDGASYYYKIITVGSEIGYDSDYSHYVELTCSFAAVTAPKAVTLSATNASPNAEVELSWEKATAGTNNPITGYQVYRATSANGEYTPLGDPIETTETSGKTTVVTPETNLESYFYKVQTLGTLDDCDSGLSTVYATLTCTYSMPSAPTTVTVNGKESIYVLPDTPVTLEWRGASQGANNPIKGYSVYCDGKAIVEGLATTVNSYEVTANAESGKSHTFTVVTLGEFMDSAPSVGRVVYSYTDPIAPTTLTVANAMPVVGGRTTLYWSDAAAGGYNDITGYRVYRSTAEDGTYKLVAEVTSTETSGSCFVDAPTQVGNFYYYKVETVGSYSISGMSETNVAVGAIQASSSDDNVDVIVPSNKRCPMRRFVFGDYDTNIDGQWILTGWEFPQPEVQTNFVSVIGRAKGAIDLSTYLTEGDPRYNNRELTATFEGFEGTRLEREDVIDDMVNRLHGQRVKIIFPDDETRYASGRIYVRKEYNKLTHAAVTVTAECEPWRYNQAETQISTTADEDVRTVVLFNGGRRILVPTVIISGYDALVHLTCGDQTWTLETGTYRLPELKLRTGNTILTYYGSGVINFTYREAII